MSEPPIQPERREGPDADVSHSSETASPETPGAASWALIGVLVVFGCAGWWLSLRPGPELDATTIEGISKQIGPWQGMDIPIAESVERMLRADSQVQRSYRNAAGELVWLYVGYYGTERGGRPEHTPWMCYPSAGWVILSSLELPLVGGSVDGGLHRGGEAQTGPAIESGGSWVDAKMNELVVEADTGQRRLVHFWYATHRSTALASETALTLDHLRGRFSPLGRADGALVRISTPMDDGGLEGARIRLERFTAPLVREIDHRWPSSS